MSYPIPFDSFSPPNRLFCQQSSFQNPKSKHVEDIQQHWLNNKLEVFIPQIGEDNTQLVEKCEQMKTFFCQQLEKSGKETKFYYFIQSSILSLLKKDFLLPKLQKGRLTIYSPTYRIDESEGFAILPNGKMILVLSKDSYFQFGWEGTRSSFKDLKKNRYNIIIDLLSSKVWDTTSYYYQRLSECLEKLGTIPCFFQYTLDDISQEVHFPEEIDAKKKFFESSSTVFPHLQLPNLETHDHANMNHFLTEFYEWIGLVSTKCTEQTNTFTILITRFAQFTQQGD